MERVNRNYKRIVHNLVFSFKISYKASAANSLNRYVLPCWQLYRLRVRGSGKGF